MKILKNLATIAVAALLFSSCGDSNPSPTLKDPNFEVVNCPKVKNPITDLSWLAQIVKNTSEYHNKYGQKGEMTKFFSGTYKGTTIYLIEYYYSKTSPIGDGNAYGCDGMNIAYLYGCFGNGNYLPLKANTSNMMLIYEIK